MTSICERMAMTVMKMNMVRINICSAQTIRFDFNWATAANEHIKCHQNNETSVSWVFHLEIETEKKNISVNRRNEIQIGGSNKRERKTKMYLRLISIGLTCVVVSLAAPQFEQSATPTFVIETTSTPIPIISQTESFSPDGSFNFT